VLLPAGALLLVLDRLPKAGATGPSRGMTGTGSLAESQDFWF
jgi:hypothetical protein